MGKGVDFEGRRQGEDVVRHPGRFVLGVDDHRQPQLFAQIVQLPAVVGIADAGDGGAAADIAGYGAAEEVQLV